MGGGGLQYYVPRQHCAHYRFLFGINLRYTKRMKLLFDQQLSNNLSKIQNLRVLNLPYASCMAHLFKQI